MPTRSQPSGHRHVSRVVAWAGTALTLTLMGLLFVPPNTDALDSYNECANAGYPLTNTNPPSCQAGQRTFLGPPAPSASPPAALINQSFQILVTGNSGGTYAAGQQVIATQAAWQQYWAAVHAGLATEPPLLPVDFATNNVIAITAGVQMTTGYALDITSITTTEGTQVLATESVPSIGCPVNNTHTNPYLIVETTKLAVPVAFHISIEHRQCSH